MCRSVCVRSPVHHNQKALLAEIKVFIDVNDAYDVGTRRRPPVELNFPAGFGTILQHLEEKELGMIQVEDEGVRSHSSILRQTCSIIIMIIWPSSPWHNFENYFRASPRSAWVEHTAPKREWTSVYNSDNVEWNWWKCSAAPGWQNSARHVNFQLVSKLERK